MRIRLSMPEENLEPFASVIDTGYCEVEITEAFKPLRIKTKDGAILSVTMRENGFLVKYEDFAVKVRREEIGTFQFKNGEVNRLESI